MFSKSHMKVSLLMLNASNNPASKSNQEQQGVEADEPPSKRQDLTRNHLCRIIDVLGHKGFWKLSELVAASVQDAIALNCLHFEGIRGHGVSCLDERSDREADLSRRYEDSNHSYSRNYSTCFSTSENKTSEATCCNTEDA